jgi:hypothetical protein
MISPVSAAPSGPVAIAVAPNGGRRTKRDHPAIPLTPTELASTAAACRDAGAAMLHLHVRDADGRHLLDAEAYGHALAAIAAEVGDDLFLQVSSEALGRYRPAQQMAVVRAVHPPGVSLGLREYTADQADERAFAGFLAWLFREQIVPQFILYAPEEADELRRLQERGLVPWRELRRVAAPGPEGFAAISFVRSAGLPPLDGLCLRPPRSGLRCRGSAARGGCTRGLREQSPPSGWHDRR